MIKTISINEIKKTQHPKSQDFWLKLIYRKFSIYFSWLFVNLGFSANAVTFIGFLIDALTIYLVLIKEFIWAAVLVQIALTIDAVDGEVARYWNAKRNVKNPKKFGAFFDSVLGVVGSGPVIFAAGYVHGLPWLGFLAASGLYMINLAGASAAANFTENKSSTYTLRKKVFGKLTEPLTFGMCAQRGLMTLVVLGWQPKFFLWAFAIISNLYWIARFYAHRKL